MKKILFLVIIALGFSSVSCSKEKTYLDIGIDYDNTPLNYYNVKLGASQLPEMFLKESPHEVFIKNYMHNIRLNRFGLDINKLLCASIGNILCVEINKNSKIDKIAFFRPYGGKDAHDKKRNLPLDLVSQVGKYKEIYGEFHCINTVSKSSLEKIDRGEEFSFPAKIVRKCTSTFNEPRINIYMTLDAVGGDLISVFSN